MKINLPGLVCAVALAFAGVLAGCGSSDWGGTGGGCGGNTNGFVYTCKNPHSGICCDSRYLCEHPNGAMFCIETSSLESATRSCNADHGTLWFCNLW